MRDAEFNHPRLVEVYDAEPDCAPADDFFVALAGEAPGSRVLDLGCGTGRLALRLAAVGHHVTGIDPSAVSLAAARGKPFAERVRWIEGTAEASPASAFDLALMTGHVAQFLVIDQEWTDALRALRRALLPGGRLAFHVYDPAARAWEKWNPRDSRRQVVLRDGSTVAIWTEVTALGEDTVSFTRHYRFSDGEQLRSDSTLRFWSEARLRATLADAGFTIERLHGGWRGQPVGAGDGELVMVARR